MFLETVGIVRDSKYGNLREDARPFIYVPFAQEEQLDRAAFIVRGARDESGLAAGGEVDPICGTSEVDGSKGAQAHE